VESQATWCRYMPCRRSAILRETFSLGVITKSLVILVFRHTEDDTTLLSACLSSGVGINYTDRLGVFRHTEDETALPPGRPLLRCGHQVRRDKNQLPWCLDTPWTIRRCFQQASPRAWAPKATLSQVSRHAEDDTTLRSVGLSLSVGTQYEQVGFSQDKSSFASERCRGRKN